MPRKGTKKVRACSRCYEAAPKAKFTGDNKRCDKCVDEKSRQLRPSSCLRKHHDEMLAKKPDGCPVEFAAEKRGLNVEILWEMVRAHKDVCIHLERHKGGFNGRTPEQIAIDHFGDPDRTVKFLESSAKKALTKGNVDRFRVLMAEAESKKNVDKDAINRKIVTYLSASVDAATWLGWFYPYSKRHKLEVD